MPVVVAKGGGLAAGEGASALPPNTGREVELLGCPPRRSGKQVPASGMAIWGWNCNNYELQNSTCALH